MLSKVQSTSLSINIIIMIVILSLYIYQMYEKNIYKTLQDSCYLIILSLTFLITNSVLYKTRLFFEQLFYIHSNYNGIVYYATGTERLHLQNESLQHEPKASAVTSFENAVFMYKLHTIFYATRAENSHQSCDFEMMIVNLKFNALQLYQLSPSATLLSFSFSLLLLYSVNITECRVLKVDAIFSSGGLDPGTAMAGSYFYGYLKIILPASGGNERAGLLAALEKYEAANGIQIPVKKLYILIPSSSYIPPDLKEISDNWLEPAKSLEDIDIDRAGVKNRTYHNTVYKLRSNGPNQTGRPIYLATEGATPLKTFLEVQDKSHRYASLYREFNSEIIRNFYTALQNHLSDNPDCRDYCELVYYEDTVGGERINPAHVLLKRIARYTQN